MSTTESTVTESEREPDRNGRKQENDDLEMDGTDKTSSGNRKEENEKNSKRSHRRKK